MDSNPNYAIPGLNIENDGLDDEKNQKDATTVEDWNIDSGSRDNLDSLFEDEDEDPSDENEDDQFQHGQSIASYDESERPSLEEILEDSKDEDIEIINEEGEPIEGPLDLSRPLVKNSDGFSRPSPFRDLSGPKGASSEDHSEEQWPGLQEWIEKHTKTKRPLAPPLTESGSKGNEATSCVLVRPAREQALVFTAPFTMAKLFHLAHLLYPATPPGNLSVCIHFQHVKDFHRTGTTGEMSLRGILLDEKIDVQNPISLSRWDNGFGSNLIDGEEIFVLKRFRMLVLRDGRNLLDEVDYSLSLKGDTAETMIGKFRLAVEALFAPRTAMDGQRRIRSARMQVDRFKDEWLEWSERMNHNAFLHDVIFKIDDSAINVYPNGWFSDRPFEEAEEKLRRVAKAEAEQPPVQLPAQIETEENYQDRVQQMERRLQAERERIDEERLRLSTVAQAIAQKSSEDISKRAMITACPVEDCEVDLADTQGVVTQEALSSHYDSHLVETFQSGEGRCEVAACHALLIHPLMAPEQVADHLKLHPTGFGSKSDTVEIKDTQDPSETPDETELHQTSHPDLDEKICSVNKCNAKLHDMSTFQLVQHTQMHSESLSSAHPHQQCQHDSRCWTFIDILTDDQIKSHDIEQDQAEPTTSQIPNICPHKNCLAHFEFLNDEEAKLHLRMHAANRSSICSVPGCKVKISRMTIEEIMQHFEESHASIEGSKDPVAPEEESQASTKRRKTSNKGGTQAVESTADFGGNIVAFDKGPEKENSPSINTLEPLGSPGPSSSHAVHLHVNEHVATHDDAGTYQPTATHEDQTEYEQPLESPDVESMQSDNGEVMDSRGYRREEEKVYKWKYCNICLTLLHSMGDVRRTAHLQTHDTEGAYTIYFASKELASTEVDRRREDYGSFVDQYSAWFEDQHPGDSLPEESKTLYDRIARYYEFLRETQKKEKKTRKKPAKGEDEDEGKDTSKAKGKTAGKGREKATTIKPTVKPTGQGKGKKSKKGVQVEDVRANDPEAGDFEGEGDAQTGDPTEDYHGDDQEPATDDEHRPSSGFVAINVPRKTVAGTKRKVEEEPVIHNENKDQDGDDDDISSSSSSSGDQVEGPSQKKAKTKR